MSDVVVKLTNTATENRTVLTRGSNAPAKSFLIESREEWISSSAIHSMLVRKRWWVFLVFFRMDQYEQTIQQRKTTINKAEVQAAETYCPNSSYQK